MLIVSLFDNMWINCVTWKLCVTWFHFYLIHLQSLPLNNCYFHCLSGIAYIKDYNEFGQKCTELIYDVYECLSAVQSQLTMCSDAFN